LERGYIEGKTSRMWTNYEHHFTRDSRKSAFLKKLRVFQLIKKLPAFYEMKRLTNMFKTTLLVLPLLS
jgi:hypothetical protein